MRVILQEKVEDLGDADEIVEVADGYARNFLIPEGLAVPATEGRVKELEEKQEQREAKLEKIQEESEKMAEEIEGSVLEFAEEAKEEGELYGSVTSEDVAARIEEEWETEVNGVDIGGQIKEVGERGATITLPGDVEVTVEIKVEADE